MTAMHDAADPTEPLDWARAQALVLLHLTDRDGPWRGQ